jgi:hypothetical protein
LGLSGNDKSFKLFSSFGSSKPKIFPGYLILVSKESKAPESSYSLSVEMAAQVEGRRSERVQVHLMSG